MNQKLLSSNEETRQQKIDNAINYLYQDAMSTLTDKMLDDIDMNIDIAVASSTKDPSLKVLEKGRPITKSAKIKKYSAKVISTHPLKNDDNNLINENNDQVVVRILRNKTIYKGLKDPVKDNKNKKCPVDEKNENSKAIDKKNTVISIKQDESTTKTLKRKPNVSKSLSSSFNSKGMKPTIVNTKPLCDEVIIHRNKKEQNKPRLSIEESNKEPEHLSFKCRREMWEQRTT
ncbi:hypothetical protein RDWZM_002136 [Blomia tropicalis]|uniref:Uncharacterized protein n=1 Tax=Blomia tropicalis TaxID=40697 RepID=A0A9Q0MCX8_BLOTA|nr:hypothetical protein RDWZM_002136 [Blomia tropicalis]